MPLVCHIIEPGMSWQQGYFWGALFVQQYSTVWRDCIKFGVSGNFSWLSIFVHSFLTEILARLTRTVLRSRKWNADEAKAYNKAYFITAICKCFQEFTNLDTVRQLYEALVTDNAIYYHFWNTCFTIALLSLQCCPHISITRCTLVLMSFTDEEISAPEPFDRVIALVMLSWPD